MGKNIYGNDVTGQPIDIKTYRQVILPMYEGVKKFPYRDIHGYVTIGMGIMPEITFHKNFVVVGERESEREGEGDFGKVDPLEALDGLLPIEKAYGQEHIKKTMNVPEYKTIFDAFFPPSETQTNSKGKEYETHKEVSYHANEKPYAKGTSPFFDYLIVREATISWGKEPLGSFATVANEGWTDETIDKTNELVFREKSEVLLNTYEFFLFDTKYDIGDIHFEIQESNVKNIIISVDGTQEKLTVPLEKITLQNMNLSEAQQIGFIDMQFQGAMFSEPITRDDKGVAQKPTPKQENVRQMRAILFLITYLRYMAKKHPNTFNLSVNRLEVMGGIVKSYHESETVNPYRTFRQYGQLNSIEYLKLIDSITHIKEINETVNNPNAHVGEMTFRYLFRMKAIFGINFNFNIGKKVYHIPGESL